MALMTIAARNRGPFFSQGPDRDTYYRSLGVFWAADPARPHLSDRQRKTIQASAQRVDINWWRYLLAADFREDGVAALFIVKTPDVAAATPPHLTFIFGLSTVCRDYVPALAEAITVSAVYRAVVG